MEIDAFVKKMKDIYSALLNFIDAEAEFEQLKTILEQQKIRESKDEVKLLFLLISKIADNHHRASGFFDKLERLFQYLIKDTSSISTFISDYTKYNKRILFLLLGKKIIKPDELFIQEYLHNKPEQNDDDKYYYYLYPTIKEFLDEKIQKEIEKEILEKYDEDDISVFTEKCQIGENDSYICSLIRSDSIEDFISYVNRTNFPLSIQIKPSIYETNLFLIDKQPTLIEYAAFFGSIQIFQYLKYNKIPLTFSLWFYAIHSNNAELIHILEENGVKFENEFDKICEESIKCHHNDISNYLKNNQINDQNEFCDNFSDIIVDSLNFFFYPNEIESIILRPMNKKGFKLNQLCFSLTEITIPSSVISIGNFAFSDCSSLKEISFETPSSLNSIGLCAFSGCSSLLHITIPSSVTKIGLWAFSRCSSSIQITNHSSATSIRDEASIYEIKELHGKIIDEQYLKKLNQRIVDAQIMIEKLCSSTKNINKIVLLGNVGSGKSAVSSILSGKDVKVEMSKNRRPILSYESDNIKYEDYMLGKPDIMTDKSNKIAFIESHISGIDGFENEIMQYFSTQYLLNSNKNDVRIKILLVISASEIERSHFCGYAHLFKQFDSMFPKLNDSDKKKVGVVITKGDSYEEQIDYINYMIEDYNFIECLKWCEYFKDHLEQVFIIPKALKKMNGKSFDFEDKNKLLDFIQKDYIINPKIEPPLSPIARQVYKFI